MSYIIEKLKNTVPMIVMLALSACSSEQGNSQLGGATTLEAGQHLVNLSEADVRLYQQGLTEILPTATGAEFKAVKALKFSHQAGTHICGYVAYQTEASPKEQPFYVELRPQQIKPEKIKPEKIKKEQMNPAENNQSLKNAIHRGQIGSDAAKLAKVKFVCRNHKIF